MTFDDVKKIMQLFNEYLQADDDLKNSTVQNKPVLPSPQSKFVLQVNAGYTTLSEIEYSAYAMKFSADVENLLESLKRFPTSVGGWM
jgi:hypothetical protein